MNKNLLVALLSVLVFSFHGSFGQVAEGDNLLSVGIGIGSGYDQGTPLCLSYEKVIKNNISVGPQIVYHSVGDIASVLYLGARGFYHFNELLKLKNEKIDLYAGLILGYATLKSSYLGGNVRDSEVYLGGLVGGRYFFKPRVAAFVELGELEFSNVSIGATFKF